MPIAKVTQGNSAFRCLNYVLTKDKAEPLDTNCAADTPQALAQEFAVAFQPHYRNGAERHTEDYVAHFSISFHTELPKPQLITIAHRFMDLMGFDPVMNQFVLAKHNDTDDCHIHLIENRIRLDGQVVSDSFQQRRTEVAMRTLEEEFDLPRLKNSWEVDVRAPHVAEVRQSRESGKPIPRRVIQETIERCVVGAGTLAALQQKLQQSNVTLNATPRDDGSWALLYQLALEGERVRTFSATKLGKRYTKRGLASTFGISFGEAEVTAETVTATVPVLPVVEPVIESEVSATNSNAEPEGFWLEPGNVSGAVAGFGPKPGSVSAGAERFGPKPVEAVTPLPQSEAQPPLKSTGETDGFRSERLESVDPASPGESLSQKPLEASEVSLNLTPETSVTPDQPLIPDGAVERFWQERDGSNAELEGFWIKPGSGSETSEGFGQKLPEALDTPETRADSFRQKLEQLAAQLARTQAQEWINNLTLAQAEARTEGLKAVLQWTQSHIETLELRAIWFGLQNASDQERWDTLSAQAQQRGLTDLQQIEYAVTVLACQQGYKTKSIIKLLQQSPRVQAALEQYAFQIVEQALTQNVMQVREALRQRQEVLRAKTKRQKDGKTQ